MSASRIMMADNDPSLLEDFAMRLRQNTYISIASGVEALDYLFGTDNSAGRETSVFPTVVLLDGRIPDKYENHGVADPNLVSLVQALNSKPEML